MKKGIISVLLSVVVLFAHAQNGKQKNLYDFKVTDIDGKEFDMAQLKGKKVMIVNVASKCGLTPQYEQLQELYEEYKDTGFVIIGFPANNFKDQEPGSNKEIKEFCTLNYGVTFPMMEKVSVAGDDQAPIYKWLTKEQEVTWNFQKFLIDENGNLVNIVMPKESPKSEVILNWLTKN
ncbi:Glutathione peroxidase BsaA [bioreactor metagenome]|uniref:Glutathione peroxidase BsaA n=1 Tax=bioreactor metagenome TaxID=1076179 RepID=A0A645AQW1_9ZZZZ|nr:glutathione peroxidase [Petrimonas sp.]